MSYQDFFEREDEVRSVYGNQLFSGLKRLTHITRAIERLSLIAFLFLLAQIAFLIIELLALQGIIYINTLPILSISGIVSGCGVFTLFMHEKLRKNGDVIFNEVSDELQWQLERDHDTSSNRAETERPQLLIRIILRSFIRNTDLPVAPGKLGPLVYFLLFTGLLSMQVIAESLYRR